MLVKLCGGHRLAREYSGSGSLCHCSDISLRRISIAIPITPAGLTDGLIYTHSKGTMYDPRGLRRDGPALGSAGPLDLVPLRSRNHVLLVHVSVLAPATLVLKYLFELMDPHFVNVALLIRMQMRPSPCMLRVKYDLLGLDK